MSYQGVETMSKSSVILFPKTAAMLKQLGENMRLARFAEECDRPSDGGTRGHQRHHVDQDRAGQSGGFHGQLHTGIGDVESGA